jgi:membrane protein required for colicin V production
MTTVAWSHLNWFDYVIIAILVLSVFISFFRGFLREAISLVTWVVALLVGVRFAGPFGKVLPFHIDSPSIRYTIAFVIIFIAILIAGFIVNSLIKYFVDRIGIGFLDRILGVFFGVARGILAVGVILMILGFSPLKKEDWISSSQLVPKFTPLVQWLNSFIPSKVEQVSNWISINNNAQQSSP